MTLDLSWTLGPRSRSPAAYGQLVRARSRPERGKERGEGQPAGPARRCSGPSFPPPPPAPHVRGEGVRPSPGPERPAVAVT